MLVETGFMSNPREAALLRSAAYQQKLARALARRRSALPEPVDDAAAPVAREQAARTRLDGEPERMHEAVDEASRSEPVRTFTCTSLRPQRSLRYWPHSATTSLPAQSASVFADECGSR